MIEAVFLQGLDGRGFAFERGDRLRVVAPTIRDTRAERESARSLDWSAAVVVVVVVVLLGVLECHPFQQPLN